VKLTAENDSSSQKISSPHTANREDLLTQALKLSLSAELILLQQ